MVYNFLKSKIKFLFYFENGNTVFESCLLIVTDSLSYTYIFTLFAR